MAKRGYVDRGGGALRAHVASVGLRVRNASTQHGFPQQVLVHLLALLGGDELHIRAHKVRGKGHCGEEGISQCCVRDWVGWERRVEGWDFCY